MTPEFEPINPRSCVKSGLSLRRLALRIILPATTVKEMIKQRPMTLQHPAEWEAILHSYQPLQITYAPGEMICQAGSYAAGIHIIVQGIVSDMMLAPSGQPRNSDILGAGDLIGLEILEENSASLSISLCRALTSVNLLFVEKRQFALALDDHPVLLRSLLQYAVSRGVQTRKDPRQQASVEEQLCRLLLALKEAGRLSADDGRVALPIEISQRALGDLLCMSTRQLRQARQVIQQLEIDETGIAFDEEEVRQIIENAFASAG